jgi:hypothetical protein
MSLHSVQRTKLAFSCVEFTVGSLMWMSGLLTFTSRADEEYKRDPRHYPSPSPVHSHPTNSGTNGEHRHLTNGLGRILVVMI